MAAPMVAGDTPTVVIDTWLKTNALPVITGTPIGTPNLLLNTAGL